jgi:hypothetical protein
MHNVTCLDFLSVKNRKHLVNISLLPRHAVVAVGVVGVDVVVDVVAGDVALVL